MSASGFPFSLTDRRTWLQGLAAGALLALAGCGSAPDKGTGELVLHVGDQRGLAKAMLDTAGEGRPEGYRLQWANFIAGPPIIAAQTGGSLDAGWMAETPLVFAQAAGSPVKVVGVSRVIDNQGSGYALVVRPDSPIRSVKDLKGKSVAFMRGTVLHYMVARLLADAGLSLDDIKAVEVNSLGSSLLDKGSTDALTLTEPFLTDLQEAGKVRVIATGAAPTTQGLNYFVASDAALADPKRAKAIGDLVVRMARATRWQDTHPAEAAPALAQVYKVDPRIARKIIERSPSRYVPIDSSVIAAQQSEADLFHKLGLIRNRLDASKIFDTRFNAQVAQVEKAP